MASIVCNTATLKLFDEALLAFCIRGSRIIIFKWQYLLKFDFCVSIFMQKLVYSKFLFSSCCNFEASFLVYGFLKCL